MRPTKLLGKQKTFRTKSRQASTRPICLACASVTDALFRRAAITGTKRNVAYTFVSVSESFRWCPACGPVLETMTMTFGELLDIAARAKQNRITEATKISQGLRYPGRIKNPRKGNVKAHALMEDE